MQMDYDGSLKSMEESYEKKLEMIQNNLIEAQEVNNAMGGRLSDAISRNQDMQ